MAELLTSRQNRSKKGKFAKLKLKSPDDMTDENNNDIVKDLDQHIQWNEGRRIVELGTRQQECGGYFNGSIGSISSPDNDGDGRYDSNADCWWTIAIGKNNIIELTSTFRTGGTTLCGNDFLEIFDGDDLLETYCEVFDDYFRSISGLIHLHFVSDDFFNMAGFIVSFNVREVHCGGYLRDQRGTITFPDEDFDRIINEAIDCVWTFEAELSNKIEYQIHNYLIDRDGSWKCEFAYIKVFYGDSLDKTMCGRRDADSGYRLQTDRTPENKMSVEFHANSGFTIAYFNMSYWIIEVHIKHCGGHLTSSPGQILSPDEDQDGIYDNNVDCTWTVIADEGSTIQYRITRLSILGSFHCYRDKLELFDGDVPLFWYCDDYPRPSLSGQTKSNVLRVTFSTDDANGGIGFAINYQFITADMPNSLDWPPGHYALPLSVYGCPASVNNNWSLGYVNISFKHEIRLYENQLGIVGWNAAFLLQSGPYGPYSYQLNFCTMSSNTSAVSTRWPVGRYSIFSADRVRRTCPEGFEADNKSMELPDIQHINYDGDLPVVDFDISESTSRISFLLCLKLEIGEPEQDIRLPYSVLKGHMDTSLLTTFYCSCHVYTEELYFESAADNSTIYTWLTFVTIIPDNTAELLELVKDPEELNLLKKGLKVETGFMVIAELPTPTDVIQGYRLTKLHPELFDQTVSPHWLLYDIGHSIVVSQLVVLFDDYAFMYQSYFEEIEVLLSVTRWGSFNNGGSQCFHDRTRFDMLLFTCINGEASAGRFITLVIRDIYDWRMRDVSGFLRITVIQAYGALEMESCYQSLGLTDGFIKDFQISASSEYPRFPAVNVRPREKGWCAMTHDEHPHIQIDFLQPTVVEGFRVLNWKYVDYLQDSFGVWPNLYIMGAYKIGVLYRSQDQTDGAFQFKQAYYVDRSLPLETAQTFIFLTSIKATSLRLQPLMPLNQTGLKCLKIELIGCLQDGHLSLQCAEKEESSWWSTDSPFVTLPATSPALSTSTLQACKTLCIEESIYCSAFVYDVLTRDCLRFKESTIMDYQEYISDNKAQNGYNKVCHSEKSPAKTYSLFSTTDKVIIDTKIQIGKPGILNNIEFPFHYARGSVWLWEIFFGQGKYVNIIFLNISLNVYSDQLQGVFNSKYQTFTDRADRVYIFEPDYYNHVDTLHYDVPKWIEKVTYLTYLKYALPIKTFYRGVSMIDSSYNNKHPSFRAHGEKVYVMFNTNVPDEAEQLGSGFRAYVFYNDTPTCMSTETIDFAARCPWPSAAVITRAFLGQHVYDEYWTIGSDSQKTLFLYFEKFDIGCRYDIRFTISISDSPYCNINKPLGKLAAAFFRMELHINPRNRSLIDGFIARYELEQYDPSANASIEIISDEIVVDKYIRDTKRACIKKFKKCYISWITDDSWLTAQAQCASLGWQIVSIHSRAEQNVVREVVGGSNFFGPEAYIGLQRTVLPNGKDEYVWADGKPVTFLAWGENQPASNPGYDCTDMYVTLDGDRWRLIPCNDPTSTGNVLCEYQMLDLEEEISEGEHIYHNHIDAEVAGIELAYFLCDSGEFISLLGRCNYITDCRDGSDEIGCEKRKDTCSIEEYQCPGGGCVSVNVLCDHFQDCPTGDDEYCFFPECPKNDSLYLCDNSRCIDHHKRCDGKDDCMDGSDEVNCAATQCNDGNSFYCGKLNCIPKSHVCDGVADCAGGIDEYYCGTPTSCAEWWNAGYKENGLYKIGGITLECDFREKNKGTMHVTTKVHNVGLSLKQIPKTDDNVAVMYSDHSQVHVLIKDFGESCSISLDYACVPWMQYLYEINKNISQNTEDDTSICHCTRFTHWLNESAVKVTRCNGEPINDERLVYISNFHGHPVSTQKLRFSTNFNPERYTVEVLPLVCFTDFAIEDETIPCGYGYTAPLETRCLYRLDKFNIMVGCRNMEHLQECATFDCPRDYMKCPKSFCLEVQLVCDGQDHCENGEDELHCGNRTCVSQYQCLNSDVCLPLHFLCDGFKHCPYGDDERLCNVTCPEGCSCNGWISDCKTLDQSYHINGSVTFDAKTRYLDLAGNPYIFQASNLQNLSISLLSYLNISLCEIRDISAAMFLSLKNLLVLDLSYNHIETIPAYMFENQRKLQSLFLVGNLGILSILPDAFSDLPSIRYIEISDQTIELISQQSFFSLALEKIDISRNVIKSLEDGAFDNSLISHIYLNNSKIISFGPGMFQGVMNLTQIISSAYKFCCLRPSYLPEKSCYPYRDEFSSCADLMRNELLRSLIWIISLFSILGNAASLIYRILYDRDRLKLGYGIFVSNLAFSDFLMGIYLLIIAIADVALRGVYIENDQRWRSSVWCTLAGIISAFSSEASVFFICLITVDRFFVIKYPFGQIRFTTGKAKTASVIAWVLALVLAILPVAILPYFKGEFYAKNGVCLALPLTRNKSSGWEYSVSLFIGFNFFTFTLIAFGQYLVFKEVKSTRKGLIVKQPKQDKRADSKKDANTAIKGRSSDLQVARNLLLVAGTDFLCWFPIGILGYLALMDYVISEEVYSWTAVVVLPINSALNPFLYTLTAIMKKKTFSPDIGEQAREEMFTKEFVNNLLGTWEWSWLSKRQSNDAELLPLRRYVAKKRITLKHCLLIATGLAKRIQTLHDVNLEQENLGIDDVYFKKHNPSDISIVGRIHMTHKDLGKALNIEAFGYILSKMIQACKKTRAVVKKRKIT